MARYIGAGFNPPPLRINKNMLKLFKKPIVFVLVCVVLSLISMVNIWHSEILPFTDLPNIERVSTSP